MAGLFRAYKRGLHSLFFFFRINYTHYYEEVFDMNTMKLIVKRYTMLLNDEICACLWQAYEKDIVWIINEREFLKAFEALSDNPGMKCFVDVTLMYPEDGDFEQLFIDTFKDETFMCEHYRD
jgi:hypothetical protein